MPKPSTPPLPGQPSPANLFRGGHSDMQRAWPEDAYRLRSFPWKVPGWRLLVVNNGRAAQQVLADHSRAYRKGALANFALRPLLGNGLLLNEGAPWRERRRLLQPLFDPKRLPDFSRTVFEAGAAMLERWTRLTSGQTLDLGAELSATTAEVICRHQLAATLGEQSRAAFSAFNRYQQALDRLLPLALMGLPTGLLARLNISGRHAVKALEDVAASVRTQPVAGRADLGSLLCAAGASAREQRDEFLTFFLAGHETTALTLCWTLVLLGRHPVAEQRLHKEIDAVLEGRQPGLDDYEQLRYTEAVVLETLRLYPPLPILSREALEDDTIDGNRIAAGSEVLVVPWLVHRHRGYWPDAERFRPDRFLAPVLPRRQRDAFIPFGAGPRHCPGRRLGLTEAVLLLAMIAQRFRLRPLTSVEPRPQALLSLRPQRALHMRLFERS